MTDYEIEWVTHMNMKTESRSKRKRGDFDMRENKEQNSGKGNRDEHKEKSYVMVERMFLSEEPEDAWKEPLPQYVDIAKEQGEFTVEDYSELPKERMWELIDGVLYDMKAPNLVHRMIASELSFLLDRAIFDADDEWVSFGIPVNVRLDKDEKTLMQPDLSVICDRDKMHKTEIWGAPDLVIEIFSSDTKKRDMTIKLRKYSEGGVREYWMIDPEQRRVIVYLFEEEERQFVYGFEDDIPLGIVQGTSTVPFSEIYKTIKFAYRRSNPGE